MKQKLSVHTLKHIHKIIIIRNLSLYTFIKHMDTKMVRSVPKLSHHFYHHKSSPVQTINNMNYYKLTDYHLMIFREMFECVWPLFGVRDYG